MNTNDLFRKKSIDQIKLDAAAGMTEHAQEDVGGEGGGLRRTLGVFDLTMLGIAAIVGAGIFAMIGGASYRGGPAVIFLFIFAAIACGFSALCYAEFASRIPIAGSAYTYAYASLGELIAWIIGWDLIVEYAIGNIAVAISWSDYFTGMLKGYGINVPLHFTMDFLTAKRGFASVNEALGNAGSIEALRTACENADAAVSCSQIEAFEAWASAPQVAGIPIVADIPALLITLGITALVYIGIRESKRVANVMTILKVAVILLVIVLGAFYVQPENWSPFAPNGFAGVMTGVAAVFFAYIGFDALSTTAEECKDPHKDLPRAMIYSLLICTVLYILLALVLTGMVNYTRLNVGDPLAFAFGPEGADISWIAGIIAVSAVIALATVFLVFQIGQPRLWMAMSRDGLLPKVFSSIHPRFRTPWFSTIITGLVVAIPALFMNLTEVTDLAVIGTLFAFFIVCAGVLVKDEEFRSEKRFVPYINSQFILPVLYLIVLGAIYYFNFRGLSGEEIIDKIRGESWFDTFSNNIPVITFILMALALLVLSLFKKLSLIPILGLLTTGYLMTELGITNWIRFGIWLAVGLKIYRLYGYRNSHLHSAEQTASGIGVLSIASVLADILLLSLIVFPLVESILGFTLSFIVNLILAVIVAVLLEIVTQYFQGKK